jgi:hypothetical protein
MTTGAGLQHAFLRVTLALLCTTHTLSFESVAMPAIAPKIQSLGTCGHVASTRQTGASATGRAAGRLRVTVPGTQHGDRTD